MRFRLSLVMLLLANVLTLQVFAAKLLNLENLPADIQEKLTQEFPDIAKAPLSLAQVDSVLRFLQLSPNFVFVKILDTGSQYVLEYERNKLISSIKFEGSSQMSRYELESLLGVRAGDIYDQQALVEGAEKIRKAYQNIGYLNTQIEILLPPKGDSALDVQIQVQEGLATRVTAISFKSPNNALNEKLEKEVRRHRNSIYTDNLINELHKTIRDYLAKNSYIRADVLGPRPQFSDGESKVQLNFTIDKVEKYNFDYQGVKLLTIRTIQRDLNLESYYSANPSVGSEIAQKIKQNYLAKGYARADVSASESEGSNDFERNVTFHISEGPLVHIEKIQIQGRYSQKPQFYTHALNTLGSPLLRSDLYNKEQFDAAVNNLILHLQNQGYLQARLITLRTQYNKERDRVTLIINLDEGPLTKIDKVYFVGNRNIESEELLKVSGLQEGPLRLEDIENAVQKVKFHYKNLGYIEMALLNESDELVTFEDNNTRAFIKFNIYEGPRVRASSILIEGNTFTKDYVIYKELEFNEGDYLSPKKIDESVARLQRTGFFSNVELKTLEENTSVEDRTVLIKVSERYPGVFTIGAGATNERVFTLRGYVAVSYRNLYGTGRGASLRLEGNYNVADIKYLESRVVFGWLEPYLFNTRIRGRINVTRSSRVTDFDRRQVSEINSTTYSIEHDFTRNILGIWDIWSLATIRDFNLDSSNTTPEVEQNIAFTGPTVDIDFRDNPFNPTRGTYTRVSAEYSSPALGSTEERDFAIEYWRATMAFTHYWSVAEFKNQPVVWANQIRGGYLKNLADTPRGGVPWDKKGFILGGQTTLRGYEAGTQDVFPNRRDLGLTGNERTYFLKTDASMYLLKSELRFPVYEGLGGALFYDGGYVNIGEFALPDNYRDSAGFGVRYSTPVGAVSLELAWKLDAKPGEEPWRFHLSIGTF